MSALGTASAVIDSVRMRMLRMPLETPYWSMISTLHAFDAMVAEVRLRGGGEGFGECVIVNGYTHETPAGGWAFCTEQAPRLAGRPVPAALELLAPHAHEHAHAVSCLAAAIEMAAGHSLLAASTRERRVPLLAPLHSKDLGALPDEIERRLSEGFRTLKVKVGQDVRADLARVRQIQASVAGRALIRLDANQGFSRADGCDFAATLDPAGIELLEQPCAADDWDAAVAVKAVSKVPMMLDESIYGEPDIERAGRLRAARYIKLKLVKTPGIDALRQGLAAIARSGMRAVLGNGVSTEIGNWMEACVSADGLTTASEGNGFLKPLGRLFLDPLTCASGCIVLPAGYRPEIDRAALERFGVAHP